MVTIDGRPVKRLSQAEQEERRRLDLCYNYDEKYTRGHNRVCKHLFLLDGAVEVDDAADDTAAEDEAVEEAPTYSLHAVAGVRAHDSLQFCVLVAGVPLIALLDNGSTHNFISEGVAQQIGLPIQSRPRLTTTVANSERVSCTGVLHCAAFTIEGAPSTADLFVMPLAGYDVVLGTQWMTGLGPLTWDFTVDTLTFKR